MSPLSPSALAAAIADRVECIATASDVVDTCRYLAQAYPIARRIIGESGRGAPIEAYELGSRGPTLLLYGFPDPGEAVGGTTIVALLERLAEAYPELANIEARWRFVPCLNPDDQPDGGRSLTPTRKTQDVREVDWCVDDPRPETTALLTYAEAVAPDFVFALHDAFHQAEPEPAYLAVSRPVPARTAKAIRAHLGSLRVPVDEGIEHPAMGSGFFVMSEVADDYARSTFARLEKSAFVFVCEVGRYDQVGASALVEAQIGAALFLLRDLGLLPLGQ